MNKEKFDNIKIPDKLNKSFIEEAVEKAEIKQKKIKNKRYFKGSGLIAAGLTVVICLCISNPAIAANLPIIGSVFKTIQKDLDTPGEYSNYSTGINKQVESNGVSIELNEVFCDEDTLYATFIIKSKKPFNTSTVNDIDISQLAYDGVSHFDFVDEDVFGDGLSGFEGKFIDQYTFMGMEEYELWYFKDKGIEIPNSFKYSINIKELRTVLLPGDAEYIANGDWEFSTQVNVNEDKEKINTIEVNDIWDNGYGIQNIRITPFKIDLVAKHPKTDTPYEYDVYLYNEDGEEFMGKSSRVLDDLTDTYTYTKNKIKMGKEIKVKYVTNDEERKVVYEYKVKVE